MNLILKNWKENEFYPFERRLLPLINFTKLDTIKNSFLMIFQAFEEIIDMYVNFTINISINT